MKHFMFLLLLGVWALAAAQTPPAEDSDAAGEVLDTAVTCVTDAEADPLAEGQEEGDQEEGEGSSEPCVEPSPETYPEEEPFISEASGDTEEDAVALDEELESEIDENDLPTEASVEEEFQPGDEISEDFPVPLPSDI